MIQKEALIEKYVEYHEVERKLLNGYQRRKMVTTGKRRIELVIKIDGHWLTVKNILGRRKRIHKDFIICRYRPRLGPEAIQW